MSLRCLEMMILLASKFLMRDIYEPCGVGLSNGVRILRLSSLRAPFEPRRPQFNGDRKFYSNLGNLANILGKLRERFGSMTTVICGQSLTEHFVLLSSITAGAIAGRPTISRTSRI